MPFKHWIKGVSPFFFFFDMAEYRKSGEIQGSIGAVINLIVGVGVAVLVLIFVGSLGGQTYNLVEPDLNTIGRTTITGDTFTALNGSMNAVSLDHANLYSGTFSATNGTNLVAVGAGNYTLDTAAGTFYLKTTTFNNSVLTASYQYQDTTVGDSVKNGVINSFNALESTGQYLPIIVLAIVIALVLFLVLGLGRGGVDGNKNTAL